MEKIYLKKCGKSNKGITLIALIITIIVLLILAGITISALTGSDSAPAKANEAKQKNDIGAVKDEIALTVQNAQTEAYDDIYVKNNQSVKSTSATTTVGQRVINAVLQHFGGTARGTSNANDTLTATATKGLVDVSISQAKDGNAEITLATRDFTQTGSISLNNAGVLTWTALTENSGTQQQGEGGGGQQENVTVDDAVYRGLATHQEVDENLFTYEILSGEACRIIGINWNYLRNTLNIADDEYDYLKSNLTEQDIPNTIKKLVIPDEVKLDEQGNLVSTGTVYKVVCFYPTDGYSSDSLCQLSNEVIFPSTIVEIPDTINTNNGKIYFPPNLGGNYAGYYAFDGCTSVDTASEIYFTGGNNLSISFNNNSGSGGTYDLISFTGTYTGRLPTIGNYSEYIDVAEIDLNIDNFTSVPDEMIHSTGLVVLPNTVTEYGDECLHCGSLTIPNVSNITKIGNSAFGGAEILNTSLVFGSALTEMSGDAFDAINANFEVVDFRACTYLGDEDGVATIGISENVGKGLSIETLYLPPRNSSYIDYYYPFCLYGLNVETIVFQCDDSDTEYTELFSNLENSSCSIIFKNNSYDNWEQYMEEFLIEKDDLD